MPQRYRWQGKWKTEISPAAGEWALRRNQFRAPNLLAACGAMAGKQPQGYFIWTCECLAA